MAKLVLPTIYADRTPSLKAFEEELEALNRFYWFLRSASQVASRHSEAFEKTSEFVSADLGKKVPTTAAAYRLMGPEAELTARYAVLTQCVTHFESYLSGVLEALLTKRFNANRTYTVRFKPADLPAVGLESYLREVAVRGEVDSIIDEKYSLRGKRVLNVLKDLKLPEPDPPQLQNPMVEAACEARNCLVHAGGKADARAVAALSLQFPGIKVGDPLPLDETLLWQFVSAVRDDARAIDYSLRKRKSERKERSRTTKKIKKAAKRANDLLLAAKFGKAKASKLGAT